MGVASFFGVGSRNRGRLFSLHVRSIGAGIEAFFSIPIPNRCRQYRSHSSCKEEEISLLMYEKCRPHLNIVRTLPCENKTPHFILVCTCCIKHGVKHKVHQVQRKQIDSPQVPTHVQNVRLWFKHKLASVLVIGQLYHQLATAPGCTTQLRDVCSLPLPVRRSSKSVSCTFLDKFFIPFPFQFLS